MRIILLILLISIACAYGNSCGDPPKIKFHADREIGGHRVLVKKQDEICGGEWTWSDPHIPEGNDLDKHSTTTLVALLDEGNGPYIAEGKVSPPGQDWILKYRLEYVSKTKKACTAIIERNVRIEPFRTNPCAEPNACAKNGLPNSGNCTFDVNYTGCKRCECKFGTQPGSGGPEISCVDRNMCISYSSICPVNTTCHNLGFPKVLECRCRKGFEDKSKEAFCNSHEECSKYRVALTCNNINECQTGYNCPRGSSCEDVEPPTGGCDDDRYYPDQYPERYSYKRCGYNCRCKPGYEELTKDPLVCRKICTIKCPEFSICDIDENEKEYCECIAGYRFNADRSACLPINHCIDGTHNCDQRKPGSECRYENIPGQYVCVCPEGSYDDGNGRCVRRGACDFGNHNCMRNRQGDVARREEDLPSRYKGKMVKDSYCVSARNDEGFECECDEHYFPQINNEGVRECVKLPEELIWSLVDGSLKYPHFALSFVDPSYTLKSRNMKTTLLTTTPSELYRRPLDICGVFTMVYKLDKKREEIYLDLLNRYPALRNDPKFNREVVHNRSREVEVYPINRCNDNLPSSIQGKDIDNIRARHTCTPSAHCYNNWKGSEEWRSVEKEESCEYRCNCFDGTFEGVHFKFVEGNGRAKGRDGCVQLINLFINFREGYYRRLENSPEIRNLTGLTEEELSDDLNILKQHEQCIVCETKLMGNPLEIGKLNDHEAYYYVPDFRRREEGEVYIVRKEKQWVNRFELSSREIPLNRRDPLHQKFIKSVLTPQLLEEYGENAQIYVVEYVATKDNVSTIKRRIVVLPIKDVTDKLRKVEDILKWLRILYYVVVVLMAVFFIYALLMISNRLYSCFLYFICRSKDKQTARLAWDSIYFFRHPINVQARNQLVYQTLYID